MTINSTTDQPITSWVAYTPTFTGFGTVSGVSFFSRRIGDTLYIMGKFTSGTSTAVEARITIGYAGTSANVSSSATVVTTIQICGDASTSVSAAAQYCPLIESNVTYMTVGVQAAGSAGLTKANGTTIAASGTAVAIQAQIPVTTWV